MARHAVLIYQLMSHLNATLDLLLQLFLHLGNNYLPAKRHQILLLLKWNRTWCPGATDFNLQVHMVFLADKTGLKGSQNASSSCPCWGEPWKMFWGLLIELHTHTVFCNKSWIIISSPNTAHGMGRIQEAVCALLWRREEILSLQDINKKKKSQVLHWAANIPQVQKVLTDHLQVQGPDFHIVQGLLPQKQ